LFVAKDANGIVITFELADLGSDVRRVFTAIVEGIRPVLSVLDAETVADELEPNDSAALIVWEDVWMTGLANAIQSSGAALSHFERVSNDVAQAVAARTEPFERHGGPTMAQRAGLPPLRP
jgi:hypothetical protein